MRYLRVRLGVDARMRRSWRCCVQRLPSIVEIAALRCGRLRISWHSYFVCTLTYFEKSEAGGTIDDGRVFAGSRSLWRCWRWRWPMIGGVGKSFANERFRRVKKKPEIVDVQDSWRTARMYAPDVKDSFSPIRTVDVVGHGQVDVESKLL